MRTIDRRWLALTSKSPLYIGQERLFGAPEMGVHLGLGGFHIPCFQSSHDALMFLLGYVKLPLRAPITYPSHLRVHVLLIVDLAEALVAGEGDKLPMKLMV